MQGKSIVCNKNLQYRGPVLPGHSRTHTHSLILPVPNALLIGRKKELASNNRASGSRLKQPVPGDFLSLSGWLEKVGEEVQL